MNSLHIDYAAARAASRLEGSPDAQYTPPRRHHHPLRPLTDWLSDLAHRTPPTATAPVTERPAPLPPLVAPLEG